MKKYIIVFVDEDGLECYRVTYNDFDEIPEEYKKIFEEIGSCGVKIVNGTMVFEVM